MNKLIILNIEMKYGENSDTIHPVVLCDESSIVLVDCGFIGSLPQIEEELTRNGIEPTKVTHIIITHHDHDHMGGAAAFKRKYPNVAILASENEAPYISGAKKSLRLTQAEQMQQTLPEEHKAFGEAFCNLLRLVEPVNVEKTLKDREVLPFCGGCEIIYTSGHTQGHISLYIKEFDTIISGDAIALENNSPVLANPQFTLDLNKATESMERLLSHPAKKIICYHGGKFEKKQGNQ